MIKLKIPTILLGLLFSFLVLENISYGQYNPAAAILRNNTLNRPTVSPYLNLLGRSSGATSAYHTLVRPQLEQRRINQLAQQQFGNVNRQIQGISAAQQRNNAAAVGIRPTGHRTYFQNRSHFYPQARR